MFSIVSEFFLVTFVVYVHIVIACCFKNLLGSLVVATMFPHNDTSVGPTWILTTFFFGNSAIFYTPVQNSWVIDLPIYYLPIKTSTVQNRTLLPLNPKNWVMIIFIFRIGRILYVGISNRVTFKYPRALRVIVSNYS